jgi:hypothetical protein
MKGIPEFTHDSRVKKRSGIGRSLDVIECAESPSKKPEKPL